ncbi:MAG: hypothetical protein ACREYE_04405 [Gammaproteobacteria bacterium]
MSETIAVTGKSVKLFKGHYTSLAFCLAWEVSDGRARDKAEGRRINFCRGSLILLYHKPLKEALLLFNSGSKCLFTSV